MRLLLLLLIPSAAASPLLVHVVPAADGHEGVAVWSESPFSGWLSDGEGRQRITVEAGTTWFVDDPAAWRQWDVEGQPLTLRLGNDGDEIILDDGAIVDAFAWGDGRTDWMTGAVRHVSDGLVYTRLKDGSWVDTDQASDWMTPRRHRLGETGIAPQTWTTDVTVYAAPDNAFDVLTALVDEATDRVHLHVYELRHQVLVDHLVAAARRGVDVQVLIDASPVGQEPWERHETAHALQRIEGAGGVAVLAGKERYAFHHLKVLVADEDVAVQSENWVPSGVPEDPSWGNRGWGAVVHGAGDWFAAWMAVDREAWDTRPFDLPSYDPFYEEPPRFAPATGTYRPTFERLTVRAEVTAFVAPDATADPAKDAVAKLIRQATERVLVQQLDLSMTARNALGFQADDPLFAALRDTDTPVRVMAAAPFRYGDTQNEETLEALGKPGRLWTRDSTVLHNKAVVADDAIALGSMNGNHHSRSENREVYLIIRNETAADAFAALFDEDWDATTPRQWSVITDDLHGIPAPSLIAVLLVALVVRPSTR